MRISSSRSNGLPLTASFWALALAPRSTGPIAAPSCFAVELAWHVRYRSDPGHRWLRLLIAEVAKEHSLPHWKRPCQKG
jgi:hypothetical protein